jgi:hypothetical protein
MYSVIKHLFRKYFEILAFSVGLILLALMDPNAAAGPDLCLFEQLGISFCPGDGLGHSISYIFRGDFSNALKANMLGPLAVVILSSRIVYLISKNLKNTDNQSF